MFLLPITTSPGEHGTEDHTGGLIARARRSFQQNAHMGVNGFIACALLIQGFSTAGIMPVEVWRVEPGYAVLVCLGLVTLSASILFSLKSLLTQDLQKSARQADAPIDAPQSSSPAKSSDIRPSEPQPAPVVLVLQESRTTQTIIEKSLAKAGLQAFCININNTSEAEQALQAGKVDLVIVEARSAAGRRSSGARDLCEMSRGKGIPVLALTVAKSRAAPGLPADAILAMPIIPDELVRSAMALIRRSECGTRAPNPQTHTTSQREFPKLEPEPLDARALGDLEKLGGHDFVRDIVAQFVADAALVLAGLAAAVAAHDPKAFREQAHALRSCAANVGAHNVYRMCLAWRDLDAQEIAASGVQCMKMLEEEFERVRDALTPMLGDTGGSGPNSEAA